MEKNADTKAPELCVKNCGFYGSAINNNMCSKCFKETQQKTHAEQQQQQQDANQMAKATAAASAAIQAQQQSTAPAVSLSEVLATETAAAAAAADTDANVAGDTTAMDVCTTAPVSASGSAMAVDSGSRSEAPAHNTHIESVVAGHTLDVVSVADIATSSSAPGSRVQSPLVVNSSGMSTPRKRAQANKGRCFECRAKVPLVKQTTNKCRCGYVFCDNHRFFDQHNCEFDFVTSDRKVLEKRNPKLNELPKGGRSFNRID
ncbi:hypothetical protein GGI15_000917 [Coemansia interrupta]|uniref:Uncharacterized protein n=1 Tax=Coemansia interrupta TaxID=1126814 RepID=A0A9W8LLW5_9FUNG|nr:hypothetical protein GGI15_000917 [Coemansia interrupta]